VSKPPEAGNAVKRKGTAGSGILPLGLGRALAEMTASFERLCLAAGLEALGAMMEADVAALCGPRHGRGGGCSAGAGRRVRSASTPTRFW
jgi:hypothetical protein